MMKKVCALLSLLLLPALLLSQSTTKQPATQASTLAFTHVTVIDATGAPPKPDMTVLIKGNRITALGRTGKLRVPANARVVDATGKFLIPGLWDMHVHFSEAERALPLYIANGVTGVRNMGGHPEQVFKWREDVAAGKLLGPRIVACGPIVDGAHPANPPLSVSVHDAAEGRQIVDTLKERGADFIKVYDGLSRETYFAIADEAKKQRLTFCGHVPNAITALEASDAGEKSIEHLTGVLQACSTDEAEIMKKRLEAQPIPAGGDFTIIPRRIAATDARLLATYNEQKAAQLFARFVKNGTWQVPTLATKCVITFVDDISRADDERLKYIPAAVKESWRPEKAFLFKYRTPDYIETRKRVYQKELELVRRMHCAGVPFMTGTDTGGAYTFPGFSLHDELAMLVQAGFTPMEALQAATRNPAQYLGLQDTLGTIAQGKIADLVLLDRDPLADISNTQSINAVVVGGRLIPKTELQMILAGVEAAARRE